MTQAAGTVVDSSVLLDVFTEDPRWGDWSQSHLTQAAQRGAIVLNAIVIAEIAPRFSRIEALRSALPPMATIEEIPPRRLASPGTPTPATAAPEERARPSSPTS